MGSYFHGKKLEKTGKSTNPRLWKVLNSNNNIVWFSDCCDSESKQEMRRDARLGPVLIPDPRLQVSKYSKGSFEYPDVALFCLDLSPQVSIPHGSATAVPKLTLYTAQASQLACYSASMDYAVTVLRHSWWDCAKPLLNELPILRILPKRTLQLNSMHLPRNLVSLYKIKLTSWQVCTEFQPRKRPKKM